MINLETNYLGLQLRNPIIVSSSGLTNSVSKIQNIEQNNAGAVVLKSLFEEQIGYETSELTKYSDYPESADYIKDYVRNNSVDDYLQLIKEAKDAVDMPIIASINCVSADEWMDFASNIENAGADAIELNINIVPTERDMSSAKLEDTYFHIIRKIKKKVKIPIAVKIGCHFTNLVAFVDMLYASGADGVVLFNRFYEPDIDIERLKIVSAEVFSTPANIRQSLRWVGILSAKIANVQISASTGIHDGEAVVKQLLAGSTSVQVCSSLYKNGFERLIDMIDYLKTWMDKKGYNKISDFNGLLNYSNLSNPAQYERSQFMKYFSGIE